MGLVIGRRENVTRLLCHQRGSHMFVPPLLCLLCCEQSDLTTFFIYKRLKYVKAHKAKKTEFWSFHHQLNVTCFFYILIADLVALCDIICTNTFSAGSSLSLQSRWSQHITPEVSSDRLPDQCTTFRASGDERDVCAALWPLTLRFSFESSWQRWEAVSLCGTAEWREHALVNI